MIYICINEPFSAHRGVALAKVAAEIFCCSSLLFEAFGMVNVEAMACGLPVVASRIGGIPGIGAEGGMLRVEPGSVTAPAGALQRLIKDKALHEKMAREALASLNRRFTWSVVAEQFRNLIVRIP